MFVRKSHSVPVVLYDDGSTDVNANSDSPFVLLLKKLQEEGCRATYLKGIPYIHYRFLNWDFLAFPDVNLYCKRCILHAFPRSYQ